MQRFVGSQALLALTIVSLGGCAGDDPGKEGSARADTEWICEQGEAEVSCSAVAALTISGHEIYACDAGEVDARCPPVSVGGERPWACAQTRRDLSCTRVIVGAPDKPGTDQGGDSNVPTEPTDCDEGAWKVYFGELANKTFAGYGLSYEFDPTQVADTLSLEQGPPHQDGLPSCQPMIVDLENASWLAVVNRGCLGGGEVSTSGDAMDGLTMLITSWCHNTHLDAANDGVCNFGAGW